MNNLRRKFALFGFWELRFIKFIKHQKVVKAGILIDFDSLPYWCI